ncbi:hypothetical protein V8E36_004727 [Tilletia maclaganii]
MTAISAPPGNLHFPLINLGAGSFPDSESPQSASTSLAISNLSIAVVERSPPRTKPNPKTPSRLSSLHQVSMSSLTSSPSPSKTPRASTRTTTRETSVTELSFGSSASTPLKPELAPPQEKVTSSAAADPASCSSASAGLRTSQPKKMSDRKRTKKNPPASLYSNAAAASLSTPELHLASDPLAGAEQEQKPDARVNKRWQAFLPGGRRSPADASFAAQHSCGAGADAGGYSSIEAVIKSGAGHGQSGNRESTSVPPRAPSGVTAAHIAASAASASAGIVAAAATGAPLQLQARHSTDGTTSRATVRAAAAAASGSRSRSGSRDGAQSPSSPPPSGGHGEARPSSSSGSTSPTMRSLGFFRRQRRWSATATPLSSSISARNSGSQGSDRSAGQVPSPISPLRDGDLQEMLNDDGLVSPTSTGPVHLPPPPLPAASTPAAEEEDDEGEYAARSAFTTASTKISSSSTAATTLPGASHHSSTSRASASNKPGSNVGAESAERSADVKLRDQMHEAVLFLYQKLCQLPADELQRYKGRLARLAMMTRSRDRECVGTELQLELLSFWHLISDGVLLCVLAKHLSADVPAYPERFPFSTSPATNLSFFIKAARNQLRISSRDLFTLQDMTSQTSVGLQRIVHAVLVLRSRFQPGSGSVVSAVGRELSPPRTPIGPIPEGGETTMPSAGAIPFPTDVSSRSISASPSRRSLPTVQQHRLLAERQLSGQHHSSSAQAQERKRKMSDAQTPRTPTLFIVEPHREEGSSAGPSSGMYRDRKASESVASLTGVVEEESEAGDADVSAAFESPDVSADFSRLDRASSPRLSVGNPMARSSSQARRLSTELGLGQPSPRAYRSSLDGSLELPFPANGSPRLGPVRRHSSVARSPGPSSLNPHRDTTSSSYSYSDVGLDSTPPVPFPRSNSTYETPSRRPGSAGLGNAGRFTSMSGSMAPSPTDLARAPSSDVGAGGSASTVTASPTRTRPAFRHHRYSSDLHLPNPAILRAAGGAGNARSDVSAEIGGVGGPSGARARVDSEVGSILTSASFTTQEDGTGRPKLHRDASAPSKHKLVVNEGGQTVTYQIGQCIGRGQFGSVYKALNTTTGTMLAVKRIKLAGKSEKEITQLMKEVDLLKNLEHPSVVKYEGLVRTNDVLSIILEWVESGSLYLTLKNFGPFEEGLCASYVVQILEGLHYLHNRQVVHCDLKAANILTTKKGNIKLSDFGVSLNLQAMENIATRKDAVGTPNWMAPEVIELHGASTESDIWSLGCTIIEMLTGKPPYHDHNGLSAMYRIVEDECPPIPPNVSEPLRDFLRLCFQKEPSHRPSAEILFEHQWLKKNWTGHKQLKTKDSVPFLRRISADMRRVDLDTIEAVPESAMERSSSSPPQTIIRGVASDVAPARPSVYQSSASALPSGYSQSMDNILVLPSPVPLRLVTTPVPLLRHLSDAESYFGHGQAASMPSPAVDQGGFMANPSLLELEKISPMEEPQPHQFVKISFGKQVMCKICWTHVKKHAVYCEVCGVVGHASCASNSETMCLARRQIVPIPVTRTPHERRRAATSTRGDPATSTSPVLAPTNIFRFPFIRNRRNSSAVTSGAEQTGYFGTASPPLLPPSPLISADGSGGNRDASNKRRRRISLAAVGRSRPLSPGISSPEVLRSPSETSTRAFPSNNLPPGAIQMVGSLSSSGSSTVSRGIQDVTDLTKAHALGSHDKPLVSSPAIVSTTQLVSNHKSGILDGIRLPRRLSVGHPYGHNDGAASKSRGHVPNHSISVVYTRDTDQSDVIPVPASGSEDRSRLKRASKECIIM